MQIGTFRKVIGGFAGHVRTLTLDIELRIVPTDSKPVETAPDWHVMRPVGDARVDAGVGWTREGSASGAYIALQLDAPEFAHGIRANLLRSDRDAATYVLLWSRHGHGGKDSRS